MNIKKSIIFLVLVIVVGCSTNMNISDGGLREGALALKDNYSIYGKLKKDGTRWVFTDVCYMHRYAFFSDIYDKNFNDKLNKKFNDSLSLNSLPQCNPSVLHQRTSVVDPSSGETVAEHVNFINLSNFRPHLTTKSYKCSGTLFNGTSCGVELPMFWESDIRESRFFLWLTIFPAIAGSYWTDIRFNWVEYKNAINEAMKNTNGFDLIAKHEEFYSEYKDFKKVFKGSVGHLVTEYKQQDSQYLKDRAAKKKRNNLRKKKAEQEIELANLKRKNMISAFNEGVKNKVVGDEICTKRNRFGYLERVEGGKVQIRLKGIVSSTKEYMLFTKSQFDYHPKNEIIWDNSYSWAKCDVASL